MFYVQWSLVCRGGYVSTPPTIGGKKNAFPLYIAILLLLLRYITDFFFNPIFFFFFKNVDSLFENIKKIYISCNSLYLFITVFFP